MELYNELYEECMHKYMFERTGNVIGIFPGAFKPPHMGHFATALKAATICDKVYMFMSCKDRECETPLDNPYEIVQPKNQKRPDSDRYTNLIRPDSKYRSNLLDVTCEEVDRLTSATIIRNAIALRDANTIFQNIPDIGDDKHKVVDILLENDGVINLDHTLDVWEIYKKHIIDKTNIDKSDIIIKPSFSPSTPVKDTYDLVDSINNDIEAANKTIIKLYVGKEKCKEDG